MIDILMATYNGEKYIEEQIQSILNQTYTDFKLIIHDDGSNDSTVHIIRKYAEQFPDKIQFIDDGIKTGGAKNNFFHLLKFSKAEYIMFADQDDIWKANKVKNAVRCIMEEASQSDDIPLMGYSDLIVVDERLAVINDSFFNMQNLAYDRNSFNNLLVQNIVTGCTTIFNRKLAQMCTEMPTESIMHDWWLALITSAFGRMFYMEDKDILYRQHGNNTEGAKNCKSPKYILKKMFNPRAIRAAINATYCQAEAFKKIYQGQLPKQKEYILDKYISIKYDTKIKKLKTIKENDFQKNGFIKKMVQKIMI